METWKSIPGYPNHQVSSDGRIKNSASGVILRCTKTSKGYLAFHTRADEPKIFVHRVVLTVFVGVIPTKPWVNHKNGIRSDNRLDNLEWCTPSENATHAFRILQRKHPRTHLSTDDVLTIRRKIHSGSKRKDLAIEYEVSLSTIHAIASKQNWNAIT